MNRSQQLKTALTAARAAAQLIQSFVGDDVDAEEKFVADEAMGLVTVADVKAEETIIRTIRDTFPNDAVMAEETHAERSHADALWVIDPLDGTNNFAHEIPHYSVSIAYFEHGVAQCGVVAQPSTGDVFWAQRGDGAWHGTKRVTVNSDATLNSTIIGTGFYYDRGAMMRATLGAVEELFQADVQGIRRMGSAALDLIYVGLGRFGGFFEYQLNPWDYAAGKLFVEEAGGRVTDCRGENIDLHPTTLLATNGHLHDSILELIRRHVDF